MRYIQGTWEHDDPRRIFVEGASWNMYKLTGFTMFSSEREEAENEAEKRFPNGEYPPYKKIG